MSFSKLFSWVLVISRSFSLTLVMVGIGLTGFNILLSRRGVEDTYKINDESPRFLRMWENGTNNASQEEKINPRETPSFSVNVPGTNSSLRAGIEEDLDEKSNALETPSFSIDEFHEILQDKRKTENRIENLENRVEHLVNDNVELKKQLRKLHQRLQNNSNTINATSRYNSHEEKTSARETPSGRVGKEEELTNSTAVVATLLRAKSSKTSKNQNVPKVFEWKCSDECSCLPPTTNQENNNGTTIIMHQSYKTSDPNTWHWGWKSQRQTWIDLHPDWYFIFWNDDQNELLAKCMNYGDVFRGRSGIQKADLSRLLYLDRYGGFYADMDYVSLKNHDALFATEEHAIQKQQILLQGREDQVIGFEWGFARKPHHPLWKFCMEIAKKQENKVKKGCPIYYTGPIFLKRCVRNYFKRATKKNVQLEHMVSYGNNNDFMILNPGLIAPISGDDFGSDCGRWRNVTEEEKQVDRDETTWTQKWPKSSCLQNLTKKGAYAVTFYSHSWGEGLKC